MITSLVHLPLGDLDTYIQHIQRIPLLTLEEENQLARNLHEKADIQSAHRLVLAHLRYVVKIAKGYINYGLALADLIQEGNIGLMKAIKRFDPNRGVRLVSFAVYWIRAQIHDFILRNWSIVKFTTKEQRKLFYRLRRAKAEEQAYMHNNWLDDQSTARIASHYNVKPEAVQHMEARLYNSDVTFEQHSEAYEDAEYKAPENYLIADKSYEPLQQLEALEVSKQSAVLMKFLDNLDSRSKHIIEARWLHSSKATLQELADYYQVSAERIRQLEQAALKKLYLAIRAFNASGVY